MLKNNQGTDITIVILTIYYIIIKTYEYEITDEIILTFVFWFLFIIYFKTRKK